MYFTTPPLNIIDLPADAHHTSGTRRIDEILYFVLHDTGSGRNEPWSSTLYWLTTNPNSNVSAHRGIDYDGQIYKLAPDTTICNHVGFSRMGNTYGLKRQTLGIEMRRREGDVAWPVVQVESAAMQCAEWVGLHGLKPTLYHLQIDTNGKVDPRLFPREIFDRKLLSLIANYMKP